MGYLTLPPTNHELLSNLYIKSTLFPHVSWAGIKLSVLTGLCKSEIVPVAKKALNQFVGYAFLFY